MSTGRMIAMAVLMGAAAFLFFHVTNAPEGHLEHPDDPWPADRRPLKRDKPIPFTKSEQCRDCHPDVWREWYDSHHRLAYTNPEVQRISRGFQDLDCLPCHLPRPIPETGFGTRPLERTTGREDGVDCFTCHFWPEGNLMLGGGPQGPGAADAPCQPSVDPIIASLDLCAPCHDQHKVHQEWKQSRFAVKGPDYRDCNDCHMPEIERVRAAGGRRMGRHHGFVAAHDPDMLKTSATLRVTPLGGRKVQVVVENSGAGHNLPTDERHRAVDLHLVAHTSAGQLYDVRVARYRNPYRDDAEYKNLLPKPGDTYDATLPMGGLGVARVHAERIGAKHDPVREVWYLQSTQIAAGESRRYEIALPKDVVRVDVRLWYRLNPFMPDEDAVLLNEKSVDNL